MSIVNNPFGSATGAGLLANKLDPTSLDDYYRRLNMAVTQTISAAGGGSDHLGDIHSDSARLRMLQMRMRIGPGGRLPFDFVATGYTGGKVFVMICNKGTAVLLEDDGDLYPSDALITQMRLLT